MPPAQLAIIRFMILLAAHLSPTPNAQSRQPLMAFTLLGCGHSLCKLNSRPALSESQGTRREGNLKRSRAEDRNG